MLVVLLVFNAGGVAAAVAALGGGVLVSGIKTGALVLVPPKPQLD